MSRRQLSRKLVDKEKTVISRLQCKIESLDYICLTADVWSTRHRSFLGVTAHWVSLQAVDYIINQF